MSISVIVSVLILTAAFISAQLPAYQLLYANNPGEFIVEDFRSQRSVTLEFSEQDVALDFRWSPDGRSILYITINDGLYEYHIYDLFERRTTPLEIEANGALPTWSPDGQQLAYGSSADGLCLLTLATLNNACMGKSTARFAAWSPDGRWIAYYELFPAKLSFFDLQSRVAGILIEAAQAPVSSPLFWSPDSRTLIFQRSSVPEESTILPGLPRTDLMLLELPFTDLPASEDVSTGDPIQLTTPVTVVSDASFGYGWSPEGQQFAYTVDIRTLEDDLAQRAAYDLYIYDSPTNTQRRITQDDAEELDPSWSPDGRWLAYISSLSGNPTLVLRDAADYYRVIDSARVRSYNLDWRP